MLIIIEGMDLTGKTTLAAELATRTGLDIFHLGPPKGPTLPEHLRWMAEFADSKHGLIVDRCHWSDAVYGPIWHKDNMLAAVDMRLMDTVLNALGAVFVYCNRSAEAIKQTMAEQLDEDHPEVPGIYKHVDRLVTEYQKQYLRARESAMYPILSHNFEHRPVKPVHIIELATSRSIH